jgi:hypothetical protein
MGYSIDFRRKVLEIKDRDRLSFEETVSRFGISKSSVSRWGKRLVRDVETHPDAYQYERAERFGCSQRGMCEALKRLKIRRGKNFFPSES